MKRTLAVVGAAALACSLGAAPARAAAMATSPDPEAESRTVRPATVSGRSRR